VSSKAKDNNGDAIYKWNLDKSLGDIHQIKRIELIDPKTIQKIVPTPQPETSYQKVNEIKVKTQEITPVIETKTVEPVAITPSKVITPVQTEKESEPVKATPTTPEWADEETQSDFAIKVFYFFVVLTIFTIAILYIYYKMDKKEQQEEAR